MTRIIAGMWGGRAIKAPTDRNTRPTTDRVREALFAKIDHLDRLRGATVLDLFAGSGALGLEALSRGAGHAHFVDHSAAVTSVLRENIGTLGATHTTVTTTDVAACVRRPAPQPFDVVLCDPPYDLPSDDVTSILADLVNNGWLAPDTLVMVERPRRGQSLQWPAAFEDVTTKQYGETILEFGYTPVQEPAPDQPDSAQQDSTE